MTHWLALVIQSGVMGFTIGLIVFVTWIILVKALCLDLVVARSLVMALMVFLQNLHAFNCRSEKKSISKIPLLSNKFFIVSVLGSIGLQILFMEVESLSALLDLTTVSYSSLLVLFIVSFVVIAVCEIFKAIVRRKESTTKNI